MSSALRRRKRFRSLTLDACEPRLLLTGDVTSGLVDKWTFNESSGNVAADVVGTNNASLINFDANDERFVPGRFGNAISFRDPSTNHIVETASPITQNQYTISFWLRPETTQPLNPRLVTPLDGFEGWVLINTEKNVGVGFYQPYSAAQAPSLPTPNVWEHYAVTFDTVSKAAQVYRNGALTGTGTFNDDAPIQRWVFGHRDNVVDHSAGLNGLLDDIRIYNRILSASEAVQLATYGVTNVAGSGSSDFTEQGPAVAIAPGVTVNNGDFSNLGGSTLKVSIAQNADDFDQLQILSNGTGVGQINLSGTNVQYGGTTIGTLTSAANAAPLAVLLNANATTAATQALARHIGFRSVGQGLSALQRQLRIEVDDAGGIAGSTALVNVNVHTLPEDPHGDILNGLIHHWAFDETSGTVAVDSRQGNNATLVNWSGAETQWTGGRLGGGLQFDGNDDAVSTSAALATGDFTLSFWLKVTGAGTGNPRIVAVASGNEAILYNRYDGKGIGAFGTNGSAAIDVTLPVQGEWTQYTVTIDRTGAMATIYRDGLQVASNTVTATPQSAVWVFGHNYGLINSNDTLNGVLDDLRVYNRVVTASEALQLANFGKTQIVVNGDAAYFENAAPVPIAASGQLFDGDSPNLGGNTLTATITQNVDALDQLRIKFDGAGPGQIGLSGTNVLHQGIIIGTLTSTAGASPLTVTLNSSATLAAVQALVQHITFVTPGDNPSPLARQVQIEIDDDVNGFAGLTTTINVNVAPLNDAPVLNISGNPALGTIAEDAASSPAVLLKNLVGSSISDVDLGALPGVAITAAGGIGQWQYSLDGGGNWQNMASPAVPGESSALLLPLDDQTKLRFLPATNFNGVVKLWYRAWDQSQGSIGGRLNTAGKLGGTNSLSTAVENATLTITPVNDAPVLKTAPNPTLAAVAEDTTSPPGTLVSSLLGTAVSDPDSGAKQGIAVTGAATAHGIWQYQILGSSTWTNLPAVSESAALLLKSDAGTRVRFLPATNFYGVVKLYYRAWDQTHGTAGSTIKVAGNTGGTLSLSTAYESAAQAVTSVDDAPVVTLSGSNSYVHDKPAIVIGGGASVSDIDSADFNGGRLRVRIDMGAGASNRLAIGSGFTIDNNGNVLQGTTVIGKRTSDGVGTHELIIVFTSPAATPTVVQQLVRAVTFSVSGNVPGKRTAIFTVSDGDGGLCAEQTKTVNVT